MKLERDFIAPVDTAAVRNRAAAFFTLAGYRQEHGTLKFKRGSAAGSAMSFNPVNWLCEADVLITSGMYPVCSVLYDIHVDPFEKSIARTLWNEELNRFQAYLCGGELTHFDNAANIALVKIYVVRTIGLPAGLLFAAISGMVTGTLTADTGISYSLALVGGIAVFILLSALVILAWSRMKK